MAKQRNGKEEPTATDLAAPASTAVATLEAPAYQSGFYEITVNDPLNVFPTGVALPLAEVYGNFGNMVPVAFEFKKRATVLRYKCISTECPVKGGHEWLPELMLRPEGMTKLPGEEKWKERAVKSQFCPKCAEAGRQNLGIPKKIGGEFHPIEVRNVMWLNADERKKFDDVVDPNRKARIEKDRIKTMGGEYREIPVGLVDGPLVRVIKNRQGIKTTHQLGPMISLRFIGETYNQNSTSFDPNYAAQINAMNRVDEDMQRVSTQMLEAAGENDMDRWSTLNKQFNALAAKKKDLTGSYLAKVSPKEISA